MNFRRDGADSIVRAPALGGAEANSLTPGAIDVHMRDEHARNSPGVCVRREKPAIVIDRGTRPETAEQAETARLLAAHGTPPRLPVRPA